MGQLATLLKEEDLTKDPLYQEIVSDITHILTTVCESTEISESTELRRVLETHPLGWHGASVEVIDRLVEKYLSLDRNDLAHEENIDLTVSQAAVYIILKLRGYTQNANENHSGKI